MSWRFLCWVILEVCFAASVRECQRARRLAAVRDWSRTVGRNDSVRSRAVAELDRLHEQRAFVLKTIRSIAG